MFFKFDKNLSILTILPLFFRLTHFLKVFILGVKDWGKKFGLTHTECKND